MKFFQPLMGRRRGFAWLILLGLPAVLVTAQTLYWQWACRRLDEGARVWMASRNVAGWRLEEKAGRLSAVTEYWGGGSAAARE